LLATNDMLILSGGVSKGKADYVPEVLAALGVAQQFHRVAQKPGKPLWFGMSGRGQPVFGLPGNPVSTLCCANRYVLPALRRLAGLPETLPEQAVLAEDVTFKPELMLMLPVTLSPQSGALPLAHPQATNTSGDFTALAGTDGFVEIPARDAVVTAGTALTYRQWPRAGG
ncbi:MAG: molybdopterin-binding protein, partial [Pseudomonadota bacterium]